ncbi:MAG: hypothetical protein M3355_11815 [Actinomycetota bacterium]|nr:hypothetical protein [Actinomycetota bacterium]
MATLTRQAPACHRDANALLAEHGMKPYRILFVDPGSIGWVDGDGQARTSFIEPRINDDGQVYRRLLRTYQGLLIEEP